MIKKHPVSTGIITALLLSNSIVGYQYYKDSKHYNQQLENKTEQYQELKVNYTNKEKLIDDKEVEINSHLETINSLTDENANLNKAVTKQKEDIVKLKEQLSQARTRESASP